jgi:hypothetical protein
MRFVGARARASLKGLDEQDSYVNVFRGNEPALWRSRVHPYGRVRASELYRGIDVVYSGNGGRLEFDLIVAPGADPGRIRIAFDGATRLGLSDRGDLIVSTPMGELVQHRPFIYQTADGERKEIGGGFRLRGKHEVAFEIASYDRTRPLVIDPTLSYSTYLGGSGSDLPLDVAIDGSGNTYVTGYTLSADFPVSGAFQSTKGAHLDAYVTKYGPSGALIFSTYFGGSGSDNGNGIDVDATGNIYIAGRTESFDLPITPGAFQSALDCCGGFVAKFDPSGSTLVYSTYLGDRTELRSLEVDPGGVAYLAGQTSSSTFPIVGGFQTTYAGDLSGSGNGDGVVVKLNATGTAILYSSYLGGAMNDVARSVAFDAAHGFYVAGDTASADFPVKNALQSTYSGSRDAFIVKVDTTQTGGDSLIFATYLGGAGVDIGTGIGLDPSGNVLAAGMTASSDFPTTPGAFEQTTSCSGLFVSKLNPTGSAFVYSTYVGSAGCARVEQDAHNLAVDGAGNAIVTGRAGPSFPTVCPTQTTNAGGQDAIVAKLNSSGTALLFSTFLGGTGDEDGRAVASDAAGNVTLTGTTTSTDFPTASAAQPVSGGADDGFVARIAAAPSCSACTLAFDGFLAPINGGDATGGTFFDPVRTFKMGSTIPVKFKATCNGTPVTTGVHTLQVVKYTSTTTFGSPIDATPQDAATTGNQFRLTGSDWQFNLDTRSTGMSVGIWLFVATLSDNNQHSAWIQIK